MSMEAEWKTAGIAGAGIMGRILALKLLQQGYNVTLFDRDRAMGTAAAAFTAAGMLAPYSELESAESEIYQLGQRSLKLWPGIAQTLQMPEVLQTGGSLVVAHKRDEPDLIHFNQLLKYKIPDESGIEFLCQRGLAEVEPELVPRFEKATYLAGECWVCPPELMHALGEKLRALGASWHSNSEVIRLQKGMIRTTRGEHHFDIVADCRGLGARPALPGLRGVRGELIEVYAPEVNIRRMVRLMHPRYRLYLVPRKNSHYVLGATQIESEDMSEISVRSALELLSALYAIHPGFAEARIVATRTNCRPAMLDNQPLIQLQDGVLQINGLYRHGYLLAPALAEQAISLLETAHRPASTQQLSASLV